MEVQEELEIHVQNAFSRREECKDEPGNATIRYYNCKRQTKLHRHKLLRIPWTPNLKSTIPVNPSSQIQKRLSCNYYQLKLEWTTNRVLTEVQLPQSKMHSQLHYNFTTFKAGHNQWQTRWWIKYKIHQNQFHIIEGKASIVLWEMPFETLCKNAERWTRQTDTLHS